MILYFSATGNSLHVAKCIALPGEEILSIPEEEKAKRYSLTVNDGRLGIISPTYEFTMPNIVSDYLEKMELSFDEKPYLFYVGTYGTTAGASAAMADDLLKKKGLRFDALFDIKMPDTWTPMYDLSDPEKVKQINEQADREIEELKNQLAGQMTGKHMSLTVPKFAGKIGKQLYDRRVSRTDNLTLTDACIGCGLCAKKCPVQAIEMRNKKPVWIKKHCVMCLGCLHRCPKNAIECGPNTRKHGQYLHPPTR